MVPLASTTVTVNFTDTCHPTVNFAAVPDAIDENGDDVPPDSDSDNVAVPRLGVAKDLVSIAPGTVAGTYDLEFDVRVSNLIAVALDDVQVVDDLDATFPPPASYSFTSLTHQSGPLAAQVNGSYDGSPPNTELYSGSAAARTLAAFESDTVRIALTLTPNGDYDFENTATGTGDTPAGTTLTDDSQDDGGLDPDPDGDGDPENNEDPTPVDLPQIGVSKAVAEFTPLTATSVRVVYRIRVENYGATTLTDVQVVDDLNVTFTGPATFSNVSLAHYSGVLSAQVNGSYDGDTDINMLTGSAALRTLAPGEHETFEITVDVDSGGVSGTYDNTATGTGTDPNGLMVEDDSQDDTDLTDPEPEPDPDDDNDPTNNNDPTPISFGPLAVQISALDAETPTIPLPLQLALLLGSIAIVFGGMRRWHEARSQQVV